MRVEDILRAGNQQGQRAMGGAQWRSTCSISMVGKAAFSNAAAGACAAHSSSCKNLSSEIG